MEMIDQLPFPEPVIRQRDLEKLTQYSLSAALVALVHSNAFTCRLWTAIAMRLLT